MRNFLQERIKDLFLKVCFLKIALSTRRWLWIMQILGCAATNISNEQVGKPEIFPNIFNYRKRVYRCKPTNDHYRTHYASNMNND